MILKPKSCSKPSRNEIYFKKIKLQHVLDKNKHLWHTKLIIKKNRECKTKKKYHVCQNGNKIRTFSLKKNDT